VLVEADFEWKAQHTTNSGIVGIHFENEIDRSIGAQRTGKVIALPLGISDHPFLKAIQEEVQVGDILYFHFNSIHPDSRVELDINEKPYYLVNMENIFCLVRNGEIIMYGGRVLAEPLYDADVEDVLGMNIRKTNSGIISEINVGHNFKKARLAHIGKPLKGAEKLDARAGDIIYYAKDADFINVIEGKTYFCMIQEDILLVERGENIHGAIRHNK
jgi:co-chaperonin GroES (HSP10)